MFFELPTYEHFFLLLSLRDCIQKLCCAQRPLSQLLCFALHFSRGDGVRVHGHSKFLAEKLPAVKEAAELQKGSKVYITLEGVKSSQLFYLLARFYTG